ncbi:MAG: hypothetical protein WC678_02275 [Parcubacteria group bacterium]|jgi:hypothetical protein
MLTNTKIKEFSFFSPILVSSSENESMDDFNMRWKKFDDLSEDIKDKMSLATAIIKSICVQFNLNFNQATVISRNIRKYYFGEIQLQDFPQILSKEMSVDFAVAQKISQEVIQKIINDNSQEKAYQAQLEKLTISKAIEKFPELGEQLVTSSHIKLKNFPEPVRPSINNWLSDYTFNLGFESHSAMDRGTYLFRNENAKVLNSTDREKISYILKAYDENSLVDVNVNTKQIVFPKREQASFNGGSTSKREVEPPREFPNQTPQRNIQEVYNFQKQEIKPNDIFEKERIATENRNTENINFSSPQKLPYEKQTIQPISQPQKSASNPQPMRISSQNLRNSNIPPGNIVNLKDKQ